MPNCVLKFAIFSTARAEILDFLAPQDHHTKLLPFLILNSLYSLFRCDQSNFFTFSILLPS